MAFRGLNLNKSYTHHSFSGKSRDIENINKIFEQYGLKVNDVKESAQVVRYIINLPLDTTKLLIQSLLNAREHLILFLLAISTPKTSMIVQA